MSSRIKRFIDAYVNLFPSQKEAAEAAGVDLSTINNYATAYKNMSLSVFDRMANVMKAQLEPSRLEKLLRGKTLEDLRSQARKQNGAWVDNAMYAINEAVLRILKEYTQPFRSREEAGLNLGLNARTFTAYLKGQIQCFPKRYFWRIIEMLKERGIEEIDVLRIAGAERYEDFLVEKQRAAAVDMSHEEVMERLVACIIEGKLKKKDLDSAFLSAINRTCGNFGEAVLKASIYLSRKATDQITASISEPNGLPKALELLNQYGEYYKRCRRSLEFIRRARKEGERGEIDAVLMRFQKTLSGLERVVNVKAQRANLILVGGINGGFVSPGNGKNGSIIYQLAKEYSPDRRFTNGDLIYHGGLGMGEVVSVKTTDVIAVKFGAAKPQVLELAQNRASFYVR